MYECPTAISFQRIALVAQHDIARLVYHVCADGAANQAQLYEVGTNGFVFLMFLEGWSVVCMVMGLLYEAGTLVMYVVVTVFSV